MRCVLGIDAAWTAHNSSGVALVVEQPSGRWRAAAVAASYRDFLAMAGLPQPASFQELPGALVQAVHELTGGGELVLVAADIPLARTPITGRRVADNLVSKLYGAHGCSTHSPSVTRPGPISTLLRDGFAACGFPLSTRHHVSAALVETYPHPALMMLMREDTRIPYKVGRAKKDVPLAERWAIFVKLFQAIVRELENGIDDVGVHMTWPSARVPLTRLKPFEDQIDALVCAWVGIQILRGEARPLGDDDAAIWLPTEIPERG